MQRLVHDEQKIVTHIQPPKISGSTTHVCPGVSTATILCRPNSTSSFSERKRSAFAPDLLPITLNAPGNNFFNHPDPVI